MDATEARSRFEAHLATLGYSATQLVVDSTGTLATLQPHARTKPSQLPVLRREDLELTSILGEGGMGRVHAAQQVALHREVAVKMLREESAPDASADLLREAMVAGRLEHPNIVPVYLLGMTPEGSPLFVMRRIEGVSWSKVLANPSAAPAFFSHASDDPLGFHLSIFVRVCEAVHFAHSKGIVHRDLKPDNVMLGAYGEVYVVDWGLAVSLRDEDSMLPLAKHATALAGTPRYMAPEMCACRVEELSERTDVFLLGAILYELIAGRAPFDAPSVMEQLIRAYDSSYEPLASSVEPELARIATQALSRAPSQRHASADELRRAVLDFVQHRASFALSREANQRAEELFALLDARDHSQRVHELFTECRFGHLQALRAWSGNAAAREGLQRAIERMIDCELSQDNASSAQDLLAQLPERNERLAARVAEAVRAADEKRAKLHALEAFQREADTQSAAGARAKMLLSMGVFWFALSMVAGALDLTGRWPFGYREALAAITLNTLVTAAVSEYVRRNHNPNAAVRRLMLTAVLLGIGLISHWVLALALGMSLNHALVQFLWWIAGGWIGVGMLFDRKIVLTGIALGAGGIAVALWPRWQIFTFGVASMTGYASLAIAWLVEDRAKSKSA
ncbi:MAG: serine/threonine-protein kinase [Polyangiales bacterium]